MKNLLSTAKKVLVERAIELYNDRRSEIDFEEYPDHYASLGEIIWQIDAIDSFAELVKKLEVGRFEAIGLFPTDEDMMEVFLSDVLYRL